MDAVHPRASQSARDAFLIQGVAALSVVTTACVALFLNRGDDDIYVVLIMGLAATLVFGGWSVLLAFRALRQGDFSRRLGAVLSLCLLELAAAATGIAVAACLFDPFVIRRPRTGDCVNVALVVVPVLCIAAFVGIPVAWWRTRRAERRDAEQGTAALGGWRRWKRVALWFIGVTLLPSAVLIPCPLFLNSVWFSGHGLGGRRVVRHTPVAVGEVSAWLVSLSNRPFFVELYTRVLETGRVSTRRLVAALSSPNASVQESAFVGLERADRAAALVIAVRIGNGQLAVPRISGTAGWLLAEHGTREQILPFLDPAHTPPPPAGFVEGVVSGIFRWDHHRLVTDVEQLCKADSPNRQGLLKHLASIVSAGRAERLWAEFLADNDLGRRKQALAAVSYMPDAEVRTRVVLLWAFACLDTRLCDDLVVTQVVDAVLRYDRSPIPQDLRIQLVKTMLPYVDHEDSRTRAKAALWLAIYTNTGRQLYQDLERRQYANVASKSEDSDDARLLQQLKDHVQEWLRKQHATTNTEPRTTNQ
jgi:hypothetical protein